MKALLKDCKTWVEIDTTCLFRDQYNTTDGRRIFDRDIKEIRDDARANMGKCRYCGALVRRGEEEKHFSERESLPCAGCFYFRDHITEREKNTETTTETNERGKRVTVKKITTVERVEKKCSFCDGRTNCNHKECRAYGVEWFTPENTFFLKYPGGFESIPEIDKLELRGFVLKENILNAQYRHTIGTYRLSAVLEYTDGKPSAVAYYHVWNCRRDYNFRYENGEVFTLDRSFGWKQKKTLDGIPADVMRKLKNICNH